MGISASHDCCFAVAKFDGTVADSLLPVDKCW